MPSTPTAGALTPPQAQENSPFTHAPFLSQSAEHPSELSQAPLDPAVEMEIRHELAALQAGIDQYHRTVARLKDKKSESLTDYGTRLVSRLVMPVAQRLTEWFGEAEIGPGRRHAALPYLKKLAPEVAAVIAIKLVIDRVSQKTRIGAMATKIGSALQQEITLQNFERDAPDNWRKVNRYLDNGPYSDNQGRKNRSLMWGAKNAGVVPESWPREIVSQVGLRMIDFVIEATGLFEIQHHRPAVTHTEVYLQPTQELREWLLKFQSDAEILSPQRVPTLIPPLDWGQGVQGGYHHPILQYPIVKTRSRVIREAMENADMPIVYGGMNFLQRTRWAINVPMLEFSELIWSAGLAIKSMPELSIRKEPAKPLDFDTNKAAKRAWNKKAAEVHRHNLTNDSKRMQAAQTLVTARSLRDKEAIYFPYQLDFRGRIYAVPNFLNPQGSDLAKALLTFAEKKRLGPEGAAWLAIHVANMFGYDKVSLQDRIKWTQEHSDLIEACVSDPIENRWWLNAKKKPLQFLAACIEWVGYLRDGVDYECSLPGRVDGSCNGLQVFAGMLRDEVTGRMVNLVPSDVPNDLYATVAEQFNLAMTQIATGEKDPTPRKKAVPKSTAKSTRKVLDPEALLTQQRRFARMWVEYHADRDDTKRGVMVLPYGGTREAIRKYLMASVLEKIGDGKTNPFGEEIPEAVAFGSGVMWEILSSSIPGPRAAMDYIQACVRTAIKDQKGSFMVEWLSPSRCPIKQRYQNMTGRRIRTKIAGQVFRTALLEELPEVDRKRQASASAPNLVHGVDAAVAVSTMIGLEERGVMGGCATHDEFGTWMSDMPAMFESVRDKFVTMMEDHDILEEFRQDLERQFGVSLPEPPSKGTLDLDGIRDSDNFFA